MHIYDAINEELSNIKFSKFRKQLGMQKRTSVEGENEASEQILEIFIWLQKN